LRPELGQGPEQAPEAEGFCTQPGKRQEKSLALKIWLHFYKSFVKIIGKYAGQIRVMLIRRGTFLIFVKMPCSVNAKKKR
jgi:hypothetical protein